ncbi:MAG: hypothetical protein OSB62_00895 [Alphaproteobacteria bacterium]|nr:hypothetical protein [Alphaproteobacteria bacterium]
MKVLFTAALTLLAIDAQASKAPDQPSCDITGKVLKIEKRNEPGRGLSEGLTNKYLDVTVRVKQTAHAEKDECGNMVGAEHIYQMHGGMMNALKAPKAETCIKAKTNISGDGNFMFGNWLSEIEKQPLETCFQLTHPAVQNQ